jgi:hypothetical protein
MKALRIRQFLFGLAIMCSLASYIYLSAQQSESPASSREAVGVTTEENKEVVLPDMALLQKLIDLGKMFSDFSMR